MGEKKQIGIGFKIFVYSIEVIITSSILGGAWLLDKVLLAPPLIIAFRLVRTKIENKYDIFHLGTIFACMILSVCICLFGVYLSFPTSVSLMSNIFIGGIFAIGTWHIQSILNRNKKFDVEDCTKEDLIKRCKDLHFSKSKTELAVAFFIDKQKQSELAELLCIDEKSIQQRKRRMKLKLNKL